jgi:hypothetical protein
MWESCWLNNNNQYENHDWLMQEWQSCLIDARMIITIDWCENHVDLIITINMRIMIDCCENGGYLALSLFLSLFSLCSSSSHGLIRMTGGEGGSSPSLLSLPSSFSRFLASLFALSLLPLSCSLSFSSSLASLSFCVSRFQWWWESDMIRDPLLWYHQLVVMGLRWVRWIS